jgi:ribosomal protein L11 methyltransferase
MPDSIVRLTLRPAAGRFDAVSAALFGAGAEALQELDGAFLVTTRSADAASAFEAAARAADPAVEVARSDSPDIDWTTAWRAGIRAHTVGLLTVTPPWLAPPFLAERRIVIEPAMAFGTGDHETTRGVLKLMQAEVRKGDVVADLGAGSAVLAIGAAKLGAKRVAAIELDPDAIGNAEENVAANDVAAVVTVIEGDAATLLPLVAPARVVLANIISSVIRELLPVIERSLARDGVAIFSGILASERDEMIAVFGASGFSVRATASEGEWWSVVVERTAV